MQQYLTIFIAVILTLLTVMLIAVGVVVIQLVQKMKYTIDRVNNTIDLVEVKVTSLTSPLQNLSGMAASLGSGLRVFESFVSWMNRNKK